MTSALSDHSGLMRAALATGALAALPACTGAMVADITPGTTVEIQGISFSVSDTARGVTVRNFETGATSPDLLLEYAGRAAERVSGCPLTNIIKETGVNTYYATVSCPLV